MVYLMGKEDFVSSAATDTEHIYYLYPCRFDDDDNGENLFLFQAPTTPKIKVKKKPSKWLQKVIKNRGMR